MADVYLSHAELAKKYCKTDREYWLVCRVRSRIRSGKTILFNEQEFLERLAAFRYRKENGGVKPGKPITDDGRWYPDVAFTGKPWSKEEEREFNRRNPFSRGLAARLVAGLALRRDDDCRVSSAGKPKFEKGRN